MVMKIVCKDCTAHFNSKHDDIYCDTCSIKHLSNKLGYKAKKYSFLEPVTVDDKNWNKERREQWKRESELSQARIISKFSK